MKPTSLPNGHGGGGGGVGGGVGGGGQGKSVSPCGSLVNHVAIDDERLLRDMYEFGDKLGKGSFGVVWHVTQTSSGQHYACKIINKEKVRCECLLLGGPGLGMS